MSDIVSIDPTTRVLTASQLIADLQAEIEEHGDLPIHIGLKGDRAECCAMATFHGEAFALIDAETANIINDLARAAKREIHVIDPEADAEVKQ